MIVTIDKSEINAIKYACGLLDYKLREYTNEQNEKLIQVEITDREGEEVSVNMSWHIARQVELKLQVDGFIKR